MQRVKLQQLFLAIALTLGVGTEMLYAETKTFVLEDITVERLEAACLQFGLGEKVDSVQLTLSLNDELVEFSIEPDQVTPQNREALLKGEGSCIFVFIDTESQKRDLVVSLDWIRKEKRLKGDVYLEGRNYMIEKVDSSEDNVHTLREGVPEGTLGLCGGGLERRR